MAAPSSSPSVSEKDAFSPRAPPRTYVRREAEESELSSALVSLSSSPGSVLLSGVLGSGKSCLLSAVLAQVSGSFPDGVFVLEVGSLRRDDGAASSVDSVLLCHKVCGLVNRLSGGRVARSHCGWSLSSLRVALSVVVSPRALIVLEDVCHREVLSLFRQVEHLRLVVVTRSPAEVALGTERAVVVPPVSANVSAALWQAHLGGKATPEQQDMIASCEGNPLCLAILAGFVRGQPGHEADFHRAKEERPFLAKLSLAVPGFLLAQLERDRLLDKYLALSVLAECTPIDTQPLSVLWDCGVDEANGVLDRFAQLALLTVQDDAAPAELLPVLRSYSERVVQSIVDAIDTAPQSGGSRLPAELSSWLSSPPSSARAYVLPASLRYLCRELLQATSGSLQLLHERVVSAYRAKYGPSVAIWLQHPYMASHAGGCVVPLPPRAGHHLASTGDWAALFSLLCTPPSLLALMEVAPSSWLETCVRDLHLFGAELRKALQTKQAELVSEYTAHLTGQLVGRPALADVSRCGLLQSLVASEQPAMRAQADSVAGTALHLLNWTELCSSALQRRLGHASPLRHAALSPDQRLVATCGGDLQCRLFSVSDGALLSSCSALPSPAVSVHFVSGSVLCIRCWDSVLVCRVQAEALQVDASLPRTASAWSCSGGSGDLLSVGSEDGTLQLSVVSVSGAWSWQGRVHSQAVSCVDVRASAALGEWLLASCAGTEVRVSRVQSSGDGAATCTTVSERQCSGRVLAVGFRGDSVVLVSGRQVTVWDWHRPKEVCEWTSHLDLTGVATAPDGSSLVLATSLGPLLLYSWDGCLLSCLRGHGGRVTAVQWSSSCLLTASEDHSAALWQMSPLPSEELLLQPRLLVARQRKDVLYVAAVDMRNQLRMLRLDRAGQRCEAVLAGKSRARSPITALTMSLDGRLVAFGCHDGDVFVQPDPVEPHSAAVSHCEFSHDGRLLATCSEDTTLKICSGQGDVRVLRGHKAPVLHCSFSQDDAHLVSWSEDHALKRWDVHSATCTLDLDALTCYGVATHLDAMLVASTDRSVALWSSKPAKKTHSLQGNSEPLTGCLINQTGGATAVDALGNLYLWRDGALVATRDAGMSKPKLEDGHDGRAILVGRALALWDTHQLTPITEVKSALHNTNISVATHVHGTNTIAALDSAGCLYLWDSVAH